MCHCAIHNVVDANGPMYKLKFYHAVAVIATNYLEHWMKRESEQNGENKILSRINFVVSFFLLVWMGIMHGCVRVCMRACVHDRVHKSAFVLSLSHRYTFPFHYITATHLHGTLTVVLIFMSLIGTGTAGVHSHVATIKSSFIRWKERGERRKKTSTDPKRKCWEMIRSKSIFKWFNGVFPLGLKEHNTFRQL